MQVMNFKENKALVEEAAKTSCLKQSDGILNESQEEGLLTYEHQDKLCEAVHEQTPSLVGEVQSKTESTLIQQCGSSKMATGRKGSKKEGQPMWAERKRDDETEPKKVKQCQRWKSTGVTSTESFFMPTTSSKAYISTSVNNKGASVTNTTLPLPSMATSSSMQWDSLEEGTTKEPQMHRSSNTLSKSRVSTSGKKKPHFARMPHNVG